MIVGLLFKILLIGTMIATAGSLLLGLLNMLKGGKDAQERSNKMMRFRVIFQGLSILIFSLILFFKTS